MSTILANRRSQKITERDALIIAHHQGRLSRENLLRELQKIDARSIEAQFGGRYPILTKKRPGDIVMAADAGHVRLSGQGV